MRESRPLLFLIALVLLYIGSYLPIDLLVNRRVSRVNYELIQVGMSLTLIESIMGPGEYGGVGMFCTSQRERADGVSYRQDNFSKTRSWTSDDDTHRITVFLDSQDRVIGKAYSCTSRVGGLRWVLDQFPLWTIVLAEVVGVVLIIYLILTWLKRHQRCSGVYFPTIEIPAFLSQKDDS